MKPNYWDNPEYNIPDESEVNPNGKRKRPANIDHVTDVLRRQTKDRLPINSKTPT